jgi:uncharacterized coiled-coil DUF342 family protein
VNELAAKEIGRLVGEHLHAEEFGTTVERAVTAVIEDLRAGLEKKVDDAGASVAELRAAQDAARARAEEAAASARQEVTDRLAAVPDEAKVRELAAAAAVGALGKRLADLEAELAKREPSAEIFKELESSRATVGALRKDVDKLRELAARAGADEGLAQRVGELAAALAEVRKTVEEVRAGGAGGVGGLDPKMAARIQRIEDSFEALPTYLQGTATVYQRLNRLEKSLERAPAGGQVEEEIKQLREEVTGTAKKLSVIPGADSIRDMAEQALEETLTHIERLEAEHTEGRAGEHLRGIIRQEVRAAGGGGMDCEVLSATMRELLKSPDFAGKVGVAFDGEALQDVVAQVVRERFSGRGLAAFIKDVVDKTLEGRRLPGAEDLGKVVAERVDATLSKGGLTQMVEPAVKAAIEKVAAERGLVTEDALGERFAQVMGTLKEQVTAMIEESARRHEVTQTRMLRAKDIQAAASAAAGATADALPAGDVDQLLHKIVENDDFKSAMDDRFRTMLDYLKSEVIPRAIRKSGGA